MKEENKLIKIKAKWTGSKDKLSECIEHYNDLNHLLYVELDPYDDKPEYLAFNISDDKPGYIDISNKD